MSLLLHQEPAEVWHYFEAISAIPRPSGKEAAITNYLIHFSKEHQLTYKQDAIGNILISKAGKLPSYALQAHVDMVCEKNEGVDFDFNTEGIKLQIKDGYLSADGTTLGADNGIGVAMMLALLSSKEEMHALECLFTVDEEIGLKGAEGLEEGFIQSSTLINLDSEEDNEIFVGCAGGCETSANFTIDKIDAPSNLFFLNIEIKGLLGGHSGGDIHRKRANANKLLADFLFLSKDKYDLYLADIKGGNLHNAIPREASACFAIPTKEKENIRIDWNIYTAELEDKWLAHEEGIRFKLGSTPALASVMTKEQSKKIITALKTCPHGVIAMNKDWDKVVQSSSNLASVQIKDDKVRIETSQRSCEEEELSSIAFGVYEAFADLGAEACIYSHYPSWTPKLSSPILKKTVAAYKELFQEDPNVTVIHAGLECGLIAGKYPELDMVSIGPTILDVHSPSENVEIASVEKSWKLLLAIVK